MTIANSPKPSAQEVLERRIIHGLACEWELALNVLDPLQQKLLRKPLFGLRDLKSKWGYWSADRNEICISRNLALNYPWDSVREVLLHEMAHQLTEQVFGAAGRSPHGTLFREACRLLRANPMASGTYKPLLDRIQEPSYTSRDRIMVRIKKLLALAESQNRYEAEAAMSKAYELIAKYNVDLLEHENRSDFISIFVGKPALRHPKEDYFLADMLQEFYFVRGLWVSVYVLEKSKMGRVLEISGTLQNIKMASYVYDFIHRYIHSQWVQYNKTKHFNRYCKSDFAIGIIEGFRSKLKSQSHKNKTIKNYFAIVRVKDSLLKQYFAYKYPHTVNIRKTVSPQNEDILNAGRKLGKQLVIAKGIVDKEIYPIRLITNK